MGTKAAVHILQDISSPKEKIWGYILPEDPQEDRVMVFYGGTIPGAALSRYWKTKNYALTTERKKTGYKKSWDIGLEIPPTSMPDPWPNFCEQVFKELSNRINSAGEINQSIMDALRMSYPFTATRSPAPSVGIWQRANAAISSIEPPEWAF